jgi:NACHT N-terminal Helical domain 1/NACHT domain
MAVEASVLAVGKIVGERAGHAWLAARSNEADRKKDLVDLIQTNFRDQIARRRLTRQLEDIADSVAERLLALSAHEYRGMTDNEKEAALLEAAGILQKADLSDKALFAADADPIKLAKGIRSTLPKRRLPTPFSEPAARFLDVVLDECCVCLITIIRQLPQFNQRATSEVLSRLSSLADQIGSVLARLPARSLYAPDGSEGDQEFRERYLAHLSNTLDTLELFGVRVERYRPRTTLTVAYISLSVSTDDTSVNVRLRRGEGQSVVADHRIERDGDIATVRVETALGANRLMLVRGEAGSGKSTLLRWLAINAARGKFTADLIDWNGHVPFLIKLRSYAGRSLPTPERFLDGIADPIAGLMPAGWVHRQLLTGRAILLIDGVDELPASQRRSVRTWLSNLLSAYPAIRVIVTSRPAAAGSDWLGAESFATAFLERMNPDDLRGLIRHWHEAARDCGAIPCPPEKLASYEAALLARLETAPHIRTLASSPLLAAMLCALNLDRDTQLPPSRMGLYGAALELLLERRDTERKIPTEISLEADQKIRILQDLAWRLSVTGRAEIPKAVAERRVGETIASMPRVSAPASVVLEHLLQRSGVIREPALGRIDFVHRTVQEYLTAKQAADDGDMDALIAAAHRDQWHETIVMAAGHANAPLRHQLLTGILSRIESDKRSARRLRLLIGSCLETLPVIPPDLAPAIDRCLTDLIPPRDFAAARTIATIGEPILDKLPSSLCGLSLVGARATIQTAWMINGPRALDVLAGYSGDGRRGVQIGLIEAWQFFDADEYAKRILAKIPGPALNLAVETQSQFEALRHLPEVGGLSFHGTMDPALDLRPMIKYSGCIRSLTVQTDSVIRGTSVLRKLRKLESLTLAIGERTDVNFLNGVPLLTHLRLSGLKGITDFSPIAAQTRLRYLGLSGCSHLTDLNALPPLATLGSLHLTRSNLNCGLSQLTAAAPCLRNLNLSFSNWVNSLAAVSPLRLLHLSVWGCPKVSDLNPLRDQAELASLDLEETSVSDLEPLADLQLLETLWLRGCTGVTSVAPLGKLPRLRTLHIEGIAPGVDLAPLAANHKIAVHINPGQDVHNREAIRGRLELGNYHVNGWAS